MSIRDIANAALEAEKAQKEVEAQANWKNHATRAVELVQKLVGLQGKCIRAYRIEPNDNSATKRWGDRAVVRIEDDGEALYLEVVYDSKYKRDTWGGGISVIVAEQPHLVISDAKGGMPEYGDVRWYEHDKHKIRSMADLAKALTALDAYIERETKKQTARKAAQTGAQA